MSLHQLRVDIDNIDSQLITLLSKRFIATREIGKLKHQDNLNPIDTNRLNQITSNWVKQSIEQNINPELSLQLINSIHRYVVAEHKEIK